MKPVDFKKTNPNIVVSYTAHPMYRFIVKLDGEDLPSAEISRLYAEKVGSRIHIDDVTIKKAVHNGPGKQNFTDKVLPDFTKEYTVTIVHCNREDLVEREYTLQNCRAQSIEVSRHDAVELDILMESVTFRVGSIEVQELTGEKEESDGEV